MQQWFGLALLQNAAVTTLVMQNNPSTSTTKALLTATAFSWGSSLGLMVYNSL